MGMFANLAKLGVAKKVFDSARKPENQQRVKEAVAKMRSRGDKSR